MTICVWCEKPTEDESRKILTGQSVCANCDNHERAARAALGLGIFNQEYIESDLINKYI